MVPVSALPEYPDGATLKQPLLFLEVDDPESKMFGTHEQILAYFKKKEEQLQTCVPGSYAVALRSPGITHGSYSDDLLLEAGDRRSEVDVARHNLDLIETFVRAFLDQTLQGRPGNALDTVTRLRKQRSGRLDIECIHFRRSAKLAPSKCASQPALTRTAGWQDRKVSRLVHSKNPS